MRLQRIAVKDIQEPADRARKHGQDNLEAIRRSLKRFGQTKPVVVDSDNRIVAGWGVVQAAEMLGLTHVQAIRTTLEQEQAARYRMADNATADRASWDFKVLTNQLTELAAKGDDALKDVGWDVEELEELARVWNGDAFDEIPLEEPENGEEADERENAGGDGGGGDEAARAAGAGEGHHGMRTVTVKVPGRHVGTIRGLVERHNRERGTENAIEAIRTAVLNYAQRDKG